MKQKAKHRKNKENRGLFVILAVTPLLILGMYLFGLIWIENTYGSCQRDLQRDRELRRSSTAIVDTFFTCDYGGLRQKLGGEKSVLETDNGKILLSRGEPRVIIEKLVIATGIVLGMVFVFSQKSSRKRTISFAAMAVLIVFIVYLGTISK